MRQTVILAAGYGSRLGSATSGVPKPLISVAGVPLIAHAVEHARAAGCTEAVVVIGHEGGRVQAAIERMSLPLNVRFVESADPSAPNGLSLLAAEPAAAPTFFLQMVDHVFAGVALAKLVHRPLGPQDAGRVLVDSKPGSEIDLDDATKVRLRTDRVTAIGKKIEPWDAVDAGCFVLTSAVFNALREVPPDEPLTVSSAMRQLAVAGRLGAVDIDGMEWADVDTPADHEIAERLLLPAVSRA